MSGSVVGIDPADPSVGGDDLRAGDAVGLHAELAGEPAHAAAERVAGDADVRATSRAAPPGRAGAAASTTSSHRTPPPTVGELPVGVDLDARSSRTSGAARRRRVRPRRTVRGCGRCSAARRGGRRWRRPARPRRPPPRSPGRRRRRGAGRRPRSTAGGRRRSRGRRAARPLRRRGPRRLSAATAWSVVGLGGTGGLGLRGGHGGPPVREAGQAPRALTGTFGERLAARLRRTCGRYKCRRTGPSGL